VYLRNLYGRPVWTIPSGTMKESEFVSWIFLPPENERLGITLNDASGASVPKTADGLALTLPTLGGRRWEDWDKDKRECISLLAHQDVEAYPFNPANYFAIKEPGLYNLTLVQRLYVIDTNNLLKAIDLPPVSIRVRVRAKE
jgi:hypothetical protein